MSDSLNQHDGGGQRRKWQEAALIVPLFGLFLLIPPFISAFTVSVSLFGIPLIVLYIFLVWISLILTTRYLSAKLMQDSSWERTGTKDGPANNEDGR
jgi:hypothetical protein